MASKYGFRTGKKFRNHEYDRNDTTQCALGIHIRRKHYERTFIRQTYTSSTWFHNIFFFSFLDVRCAAIDTGDMIKCSCASVFVLIDSKRWAKFFDLWLLLCLIYIFDISMTYHLLFYFKPHLHMLYGKVWGTVYLCIYMPFGVVPFYI